jgi:hypothetical protein
VTQLEAVPDDRLLLALCDGGLHMFGLETPSPATPGALQTLSKWPSGVLDSKNVVAFALNCRASHPHHRVCVATAKRRLRPYRWQPQSLGVDPAGPGSGSGAGAVGKPTGQYSRGKEMEIIDVPKAILYFGNRLCVGFSREYNLIFEDTGLVGDVPGEMSRDTRPLIKYMPPTPPPLLGTGSTQQQQQPQQQTGGGAASDDRVLIVTLDGVGVVIQPDGSPAPGSTLYTFRVKPTAFAYNYPYLLAFAPTAGGGGGQVEIHATAGTGAVVQNLALPPGLVAVADGRVGTATRTGPDYTLAQRGRNPVYAAFSGGVVSRLLQRPADEQVQRLLGNFRVKEAQELLCNTLAEAAALAPKINRLNLDAGRVLFAGLHFERAFLHLAASALDPRELLGMFPSLGISAAGVAAAAAAEQEALEALVAAAATVGALGSAAQAKRAAAVVARASVRARLQQLTGVSAYSASDGSAAVGLEGRGDELVDPAANPSLALSALAASTLTSDPLAAAALAGAVSAQQSPLGHVVRAFRPPLRHFPPGLTEAMARRPDAAASSNADAPALPADGHFIGAYAEVAARYALSSESFADQRGSLDPGIKPNVLPVADIIATGMERYKERLMDEGNVRAQNSGAYASPPPRVTATQEGRQRVARNCLLMFLRHRRAAIVRALSALPPVSLEAAVATGSGPAKVDFFVVSPYRYLHAEPVMPVATAFAPERYSVQELQAMALAIDTALMRGFYLTWQWRELDRLMAGPNFVFLPDAVEFLEAVGKYHTIALLYMSRGMGVEALRIWRRMGTDGADSLRGFEPVPTASHHHDLRAMLEKRGHSTQTHHMHSRSAPAMLAKAPDAKTSSRSQHTGGLRMDSFGDPDQSFPDLTALLTPPPAGSTPSKPAQPQVADADAEGAGSGNRRGRTHSRESTDSSSSQGRRRGASKSGGDADSDFISAGYYVDPNPPQEADADTSRDQPSIYTYTGIWETIQFLRSEESPSVIFEFIRWVMKAAPHYAMAVFTAPARHVPLDAQAVLQYLSTDSVMCDIPPRYPERSPYRMFLEYVVFEAHSMDETHHTAFARATIDAIAAIEPARFQADNSERQRACDEGGRIGELRSKLLRFLQESRLYDPVSVYKHLERTSLYEERVVVLARLGCHREALSLLVNDLADHNEAVRFCSLVKSGALPSPAGGADGAASTAVDPFIVLISLYVEKDQSMRLPGSASKPSSMMVAALERPGESVYLLRALEIVVNHCSSLDLMAAVQLLPPDIPLARILPVLQSALTTTAHRAKQTSATKHISCAAYLSMHISLSQKQVKAARVDEATSCTVCRQKFSEETMFAVLPTGKLIHFHCLREMRNTYDISRLTDGDSALADPPADGRQGASGALPKGPATTAAPRLFNGDGSDSHLLYAQPLPKPFKQGFNASTFFRQPPVSFWGDLPYFVIGDELANAHELMLTSAATLGRFSVAEKTAVKDVLRTEASLAVQRLPQFIGTKKIWPAVRPLGDTGTGRPPTGRR